MLSLKDIRIKERRETEPDKLFLIGYLITRIEVFIPKSQCDRPAALKTIRADLQRQLLAKVYGNIDKVLIDSVGKVPDNDLLS